MQISKLFTLCLFGVLLLASLTQAKQNYLTQASSLSISHISLEEKAATTTQLYASWVRPPSRNSANLNAFSDEICGGSVSEPVHMLTTQEYPNRFEWYIHTAIPDSTCLIRLSQVSQPKEKDFVVVRPDKGPVNSDGSFPCGRAGPAIESRDFTFPLNVSCDRCVLEWIWRTPKGNMRQCTDLIITSGAESKCMGMCQNGGVCSKSHCVCPKGYSGEYCQKAAGVGGLKKVLIGIFIVIIIAIIIFIGFYLYAKYKVDRVVRDKIYQDYRMNNQHQEYPPNHQFQPFQDEQ